MRLPRGRRSTGDVGGARAKPDDLVRVTTVASVLEAEMACSLLRSERIACSWRKLDFAAARQDPYGGPAEVLVWEPDLSRARALLVTDARPRRASRRRT